VISTVCSAVQVIHFNNMQQVISTFVQVISTVGSAGKVISTGFADTPVKGIQNKLDY